MENPESAKKSKKRGRYWHLLYIALTIGILVVFGLLDSDVKHISDVLMELSPWYLICALGAMGVFWLSEGYLIHYMTRYLHGPQRFRSSLLISVIGQYYSALTPFATGGQPIQAIYMKRYGIPIGTATSILVLKFLVWQMTTLLVSGAALIFNVGNPFGSGIFAVILVGYALNLVILLAAILALYRHEWIIRAGEAIIKLLVRVKIVKKQEKWIEKLHSTLTDFAKAMKIARELKRKVLVLLIASLVEFFAYLSVTYFVYLAFGNAGGSFLYISLLQSIVYVTASFFPLPGASGASEGGFYLAFSSIFPGGQTYLAMLLWRGFTYYFNIIVGALVVLADSVWQSRKNREN